MRDVKNFQKNLLNKLLQRLLESDIAAIFRDSQIQNIPMDIVTSLHEEFGPHMDEVLGEYYFQPMPKAKDNERETYYFTSTITLSEDINPVYLSELMMAVNFINFYLPCGGFVINPNGSLLAFKLAIPIPDTTPEDKMLDIMDLGVAHALDLSERYIGGLLTVADGQMTAQQLIGSFM